MANIRACTWDILLDSLLALSIIETCVYGLVMLSNELVHTQYVDEWYVVCYYWHIL